MPHTMTSDEPLHDRPSLTQQPFGETEHLANDHDIHDVAYLDLNAPPPAKCASSRAAPTQEQSTPSSYETATTALPLKVSTRDASINNVSLSGNEGRHRRNQSQPAHRRDLSNPEVASEGTRSSMPVVDHTLSSDLHPQTGDLTTDRLPQVEASEMREPDVVQGRDVILDMDGYHRENKRSNAEASGREDHHSVLETFTRDLLAAVPDEKRPVLPLRATDPDVPAPASPQSDILDFPVDRQERDRRRFDRAKSEPPVESPEPLSPRLDPSKAASAMDYAWDWGRIPDSSADGHIAPERRQTLPPTDNQSGETSTRLRNVEENPYLFIFDAEGRTHTFELALCHDAPQVEETAFLETRVTFQDFIENPSLVDDPKLVVRYSLQ